MRLGRLAATVVGVVMLGAAPAQAAVPDPSATGPHTVDAFEYRAGSITVNDGGSKLTWSQRLRGNIHLPAGGSGPYPVVLFLHGRHSTCENGGLDGVSVFACEDGDQGLTTEDLSFRGYDYIGRNLASHGYLVISVDANDTNDNDGAASDAGTLARSQLIGATLDRLSEWKAAAGPAPVGSKLVGRVDLDRIGLMGHSRGGEGVTDFIDYNRSRSDGPRYGIDAVFSLAPTDFEDHAPAGVAFSTLLPYCDGDVFNLMGAWQFEAGKVANSAAGFPHIQWSVNSANHNFFNTEWETDDAVLLNFADPHCLVDKSPTRLQQGEQMRVGLTLIGGFMRRYVGGETAFEPLMTGAELPAYARPDEPAPVTPTAENVVLTSYVAPATRRRLLVGPAATPPPGTGFRTRRVCTPLDTKELVLGGSGCGSTPNRSATRQLTLEWAAPSVLEAGAPGDVSGFAALHMRAAANFDSPLNAGVAEQDFVVRVTDASGATAAVPAARFGAALEPSAGTTSREVVLNGVRIPLTAFGGVDLARLTSLTLEFGGRTPTGSIQLADVAFQE